MGTIVQHRREQEPTPTQESKRPGSRQKGGREPWAWASALVLAPGLGFAVFLLLGVAWPSLGPAIHGLTVDGSEGGSGYELAEAVIKPTLDPAVVATGDLIFRRGRGWASEAVDWADDGGSLSHVGVALRHRGRVWVVHAAPAANPATSTAVTDVAPVSLEPLEAYLAPTAARAFAVRRLVAPGHAPHRAAQQALDFARHRLPFDDDFDDTTADRLYCTELVLRAYAAAGVVLVDGAPRRLRVPWGPERAWLPSQLLESLALRDPLSPPATFGPTTPITPIAELSLSLEDLP